MNQHQNTVCPGCTCLCDDLKVSIEGNSIQTDVACEKGQAWFKRPLPNRPLFEVGGKSVPFNEAIATAARLLKQSTAPLVSGLDQMTTQAQQSAWKLADRIGAVIDTSFSNSGSGSQFALQRTGKVTATLGEIASRSDLVVFWFCDPVKTHPRHLERYSNPENGPARKIIVIGDCDQNETAQVADTFIQVTPRNSIAVLATVRGLIAGLKLDPETVAAATGKSIDVWRELAEQLTGANYGAWFYGHVKFHGHLNDDDRGNGGTNGGREGWTGFDVATDSLAGMIRELNQVTRFVSLAMRSDGNGRGAENVMAWSCGFPLAVNLHRRYPRSNWLEFSAQTILGRRECDLILLATDGPLEQIAEHVGADAAQHFWDTPKIVISDSDADIAISAPNVAVRFQVSRPGLNDVGEFCRQDDMSLPLSAIVPQQGDVRAAAEIFDSLRTRIASFEVGKS